jgi:hypothetical protein
MKFQTLFEKSGAEGTYRRFKFELLKITQKNALPGFDIFLEIGSSPEPWMRMAPKNPRLAAEADARPAAAARSVFPHLSDTTLFPGPHQLPRSRRLCREVGFRLLPCRPQAARRLPETLLRLCQTARLIGRNGDFALAPTPRRGP